jgi:iron(III) transport system ATP-binding protein
MTVRQNLAFPLKVRRIARAERERRIEEALALVGLAGLGERYPGQLSGGQQQRVGLARAVVYRPALLLLDEPLSNLDALLREEARIWLKDIQMRLGITTIYVTHDQTEALSLSDRIIVMRDGLILQNGTPDEIYNLPASPFVAEFVGSANFLPGRVAAVADGRLSIDLDDGQRVRVRTPDRHEVGEPVSLAIRPERLRVASSIGDNVLNASLRRNIYVGERFCYEIEAGGRIVQAYGSDRLAAGKMSLSFTEDAVTVFSGTHQPGSAASATILAQGPN